MDWDVIFPDSSILMMPSLDFVLDGLLLLPSVGVESACSTSSNLFFLTTLVLDFLICFTFSELELEDICGRITMDSSLLLLIDSLRLSGED